MAELKKEIEDLTWKNKETDVCIRTVDHIDRLIVKCTECHALISIPLANICDLANKRKNRVGLIYA